MNSIILKLATVKSRSIRCFYTVFTDYVSKKVYFKNHTKPGKLTIVLL